MNKKFLCLILAFVMIFMPLTINAQSTLSVQKKYSETCDITTYYQEEKNIKSTELPCLLTVISKSGPFSFKINCKNICPFPVTNVKIQVQVAYKAPNGAIKSYPLRTTYLGTLRPGGDISPISYNYPAPLSNPIQAEVYISGMVQSTHPQITSGYGVLVF